MSLEIEEAFDSVYQEIRGALAEIGMKESEIKDTYNYLDKALEYNVKHGKTARCRLVSSFRALVKSPSDSDLKIACVLGWCVEMLLACFRVSLDLILQKSLNHLGELCWHLMDDTGIMAVNDAHFMMFGMYHILKTYIADKPYYLDILELFHETTRLKVIGLRYELSLSSDGQLDWSSLTMNRYNTITVYKNVSDSFVLPVACALYLAGITDDESQSAAKKVLLEAGQLVQIQEDYDNCFGESVPPRGWGSDIKDKKCTWLLVRALELASPAQRMELQTYFGQESEQAVTKIMDVYKSLGLRTEYMRLMGTKVHQIAQLIHGSKGNMLESLFQGICKSIFGEEILSQIFSIKLAF